MGRDKSAKRFWRVLLQDEVPIKLHLYHFLRRKGANGETTPGLNVAHENGRIPYVGVQAHH